MGPTVCGRSTGTSSLLLVSSLIVGKNIVAGVTKSAFALPGMVFEGYRCIMSFVFDFDTRILSVFTVALD